MLPLFLLIVRALHRLAVWVLARSLNMPEPLVHDTGVFVVAQVQTIENRIGEALSPMRRWRQFRSWFR
ncbi:hypothetical protein JQ634_07940 [Bradyrhizobium sp. AUGA SZCCT0240]|nr:hypothetical protein [Bradyrhizobium sp. AUGA SZCCT0158]MBR1238725.1 hypothetical protein [Bradyrhizobium sp. AUGA SZCCT0274]MBR1253630.1 hypothetical protein [Bradyrhizobium sp. AUGA SZCCT0240]